MTVANDDNDGWLWTWQMMGKEGVAGILIYLNSIQFQIGVVSLSKYCLYYCCTEAKHYLLWLLSCAQSGAVIRLSYFFFIQGHS